MVDLGVEESVAPPNAFPDEIHASAMSIAAHGTRIPNLGQQKVPFRNDEGHMYGMGFQIADVERLLLAASQLAAAGDRATFKAQGGEIVNIKTGRKMTPMRRGRVYVLRKWVAARAPQHQGRERRVHPRFVPCVPEPARRRGGRGDAHSETPSGSACSNRC